MPGITSADITAAVVKQRFAVGKIHHRGFGNVYTNAVPDRPAHPGDAVAQLKPVGRCCCAIFARIEERRRAGTQSVAMDRHPAGVPQRALRVPGGNTPAIVDAVGRGGRPATPALPPGLSGPRSLTESSFVTQPSRRSAQGGAGAVSLIALVISCSKNVRSAIALTSPFPIAFDDPPCFLRRAVSTRSRSAG